MGATQKDDIHALVQLPFILVGASQEEFFTDGALVLLTAFPLFSAKHNILSFLLLWHKVHLSSQSNLPPSPLPPYPMKDFLLVYWKMFRVQLWLKNKLMT